MEISLSLNYYVLIFARPLIDAADQESILELLVRLVVRFSILYSMNLGAADTTTKTSRKIQRQNALREGSNAVNYRKITPFHTFVVTSRLLYLEVFLLLLR